MKITWNFDRIFFIEKLRECIHVLDHMSHKGIVQGALPASGGVDVNKGEK